MYEIEDDLLSNHEPQWEVYRENRVSSERQSKHERIARGSIMSLVENNTGEEIDSEYWKPSERRQKIRLAASKTCAAEHK